MIYRFPYLANGSEQRAWYVDLPHPIYIDESGIEHIGVKPEFSQLEVEADSLDEAKAIAFPQLAALAKDL